MLKIKFYNIQAKIVFISFFLFFIFFNVFSYFYKIEGGFINFVGAMTMCFILYHYIFCYKELNEKEKYGFLGIISVAWFLFFLGIVSFISPTYLSFDQVFLIGLISFIAIASVFVVCVYKITKYEQKHLSERKK